MTSHCRIEICDSCTGLLGLTNVFNQMVSVLFHFFVVLN